MMLWAHRKPLSSIRVRLMTMASSFGTVSCRTPTTNHTLHVSSTTQGNQYDSTRYTSGSYAQGFARDKHENKGTRITPTRPRQATSHALAA